MTSPLDEGIDWSESVDEAEVARRQGRKRVLWKARNRALNILMRRHHEEYRDIKDQILESWGEEPVNRAVSNRESTMDITTPK
jgi:hypothetical protein